MTSSTRTRRSKHGGKRSGAGRKSFQPTRGDRERVKKLVGFGLHQDEIAQLVVNRTTGKPISEATLRKHFAHELAIGTSEANSKVAAEWIASAQAANRDRKEPGTEGEAA